MTRACFSGVAGDLAKYFTDQPIILVDIGASGAPPENWCELAPYAWYIGFDPDLRELNESNSFGFRRFVMVNKAVTETDVDELTINLTASPYCSSSLKPNDANLRHYGFADLFRVERTTTVKSVSLQHAIRDIGVGSIDWLKVDTQGTDLSIYRGLDVAVSDNLLVLDVEPGMLDFYEGEVTFSQTHEYLLKRGYWLSKAYLQKYPRIETSTRAKIGAGRIDFGRLPGAPTAIEAQYFRSLDHLGESKRDPRDHLCLWVFAMLNSNFGFALDTAIRIEELFPELPLGGRLRTQTLGEIDRAIREEDEARKTWRTRLRESIPAPFRTPAGRLLSALRGLRSGKRS